jgi:lauroyl/myristoyl acyltransferase
VSHRLYQSVFRVSLVVGLWFTRWFAWWVATGYFIFLPKRAAVGMRFFRQVFPERGFFDRLWLVWKQFHAFSRLFSERLSLDRGDRLHCEIEGWEEYQKAASAGHGGVLLMSHLGSWEVAARLLKRQGVPLMLYMGARKREQVESLQKSDLAREGVQVVVVSEDNESAFQSLAGLHFLRSGGFVSFAGDRLWSDKQRVLEIELWGRPVRLPAGPHLFAIIGKVPMLALFAISLGKGQYRVIVKSIPIGQGLRREEALIQSANQYGKLLEQMVRDYPTQWYHFEPFLEGNRK